MELSIWIEYKKSPSEALKKQIIINYLKLVHYVIHNTKLIGNDIMDEKDFFQFGIEGLSEAIERYDPNYGTKFETYAIQRIKGKIIDELRKLQIKPRSQAGKDVTTDFLNISLDSINTDDGYSLHETLPSEAESPSIITEKNETKQLLIKALEALNERDRLIISLYYYEDLNYKEIAEVLNITVSRVSQVHTRIMEQLKKKLVGVNA